jgi:hypothetical protein
MLPQETYFARDGVRDMFWPHALNASAIAQVRARPLPCTLHRCGYRYMCNDRCCRDFLVLQPCDCCNDRCCNRAIAATRSAAARGPQWVVRQPPWSPAWRPRGHRVVPAWPSRNSRVATMWSRAVQHCDGAYGVVPQPLWIAEEFGGAAGSLQPLVATNKKPTHPRGSARCATSHPRGGTWRRSATRRFSAAALIAARCGADERRSGCPRSCAGRARLSFPLHCVATWSGVATRVELPLRVDCGAALHWVLQLAIMRRLL